MILNEGLDYLDLENQLESEVSIDEYSAKVGKDSVIITLAFVVKSKLAGEDLSDWFERGYDFVLDAQISEGELEPGKWLVFVEMDRRSRAPERIIDMLKDLKTLTGYDIKDWTIKLDDEEYEPDVEVLKAKMVLSPKEYRKDQEREEKFNEYRELAGLETKKIFEHQDSDIKNFKMLAGL